MANLACLDDLIGIDKQCVTGTTPSSGLYINDLPGITLRSMEAGMNEENSTAAQLIQSKIDFAEKKLLQDIYAHYSPSIKNVSILENGKLGYYRDNLPLQSGTANLYKGVQIRIDQHPYLEFFIGSIWLKMQATGTYPIQVWDLTCNKLLETINLVVTSTATPTELVVNKSYLTEKQNLNLAFIYNSGLGGTYETTLRRQDTYPCRDCTHGIYDNQYVRVSGIEITSTLDKIQENVTTTGVSNGMSITYSLNCTIEPFICSIANQIAWPLLHLAGSELMREMQFSKRLNSVIVIDKADHIALRKEFDDEYTFSLERLLKNMELPDDACFKCNPRIRSSVRTP